jgi:outer membrane protein TolC
LTTFIHAHPRKFVVRDWLRKIQVMSLIAALNTRPGGRISLKASTGSSWMIYVGVLLSGVAPAACQAQTSSVTGTSVGEAPRPLPRSGRPPTVPGAISGTTSQAKRPVPTSLPTTVSPAIERFVIQSGRDVPDPASVSNVRPELRQAGLQSPSTLGSASSARVQDLSPLPARPGFQPAPAGGSQPNLERSSAGVNVRLSPAPLEPSDQALPINLATALRLSDARPLVVAAAQASVWVAEAQLTRAKLLWVPTLIAGADYIRHDGGGPDFNKGVMTTSSVNFLYAGPSLYQYISLSDAFYEPLVARQVLSARHWDIQSAKNDALLQTADAYFRVHQYRGMYAGALYTVRQGRALVDKVEQLSRELVPRVEVDRARNMLADLEQRAVADRQAWRVSSANLTQVLRLDPRAMILPTEHDHLQITLIDLGLTLDDLMPIALTNRPELAARRDLVQAAAIGVEREKKRPLLPIVMLNGFQSAGMYIQGGIFALGPNSSLNQVTGRDDVSLQLIWQLDGLGVGNLGRIKAQRGQQSRAIIDLRRTQDQVVADVARSYARVQSAAARVLQADRGVRTGIITFNGHLEGLGQTRRLENVLVLTFRPQEAVYSLQQLNVSLEEYFTTVAEYNRAQFELFHALGYPARELAEIRPPGEAQPTDVSRPGYLPPVTNGPPPASR